jgi:uncharacterized phage protein (TIGR01671 family)
MREFKFRAWDKIEKRMHYNVGMSYSDVGMSIEFERFMMPSKDCCTQPSDNFELMQYIGLKDKKGKEIYEGDIVVIHSHIYEEKNRTTYAPCLVSFDSEKCAYSGIYPNIAAWFRHEVVGNKYENPKLLK